MRKSQSARRREKRDAKRKRKSPAVKIKNRWKDWEGRSPLNVVPWSKP